MALGPLINAISQALRAFGNFTDLGHQEKTRLVELWHFKYFKYVFTCEQSEKGESMGECKGACPGEGTKLVFSTKFDEQSWIEGLLKVY